MRMRGKSLSRMWQIIERVNSNDYKDGLAGAGFSGSYKGMRFFMKTYDKENISVFVYPEPYNFENTKDENKEKVEFPYTHEGVDQCIDWLNQKYIDDKDKWDEAFNSRMNAE